VVDRGGDGDYVVGAEKKVRRSKRRGTLDQRRGAIVAAVELLVRSRAAAEVVVVVSELSVLGDDLAHEMRYGVGWVDGPGEIYSH
jgi:hypothetical protein